MMIRTHWHDIYHKPSGGRTGAPLRLAKALLVSNQRQDSWAVKPVIWLVADPCIVGILLLIAQSSTITQPNLVALQRENGTFQGD